ncbi:MAG TPA: primosomal protein N' [Candidatus Saccharimonadales bacterium]|nr:primosomal protein N' [Candidatus Saccharimonadales bacterium]
MYYVEVLVGAMAYHGSEALTYGADEALVPGQVVRVALRARSTLGIVLRSVPKPQFEVKPIAAVAPFPPLPAESLQLMAWLRAYYPAPLGAHVRQFVPPTELFPKAPEARALPRVELAGLPPLGPSQERALSAINGAGSFLLHGITGSGKSRVYVELAARVVAAGRSAVVLTPEIGLTAQLTETFRRVFGDRVFVLHSQLTAAQRRNIWYDILAATEPVIVIGPRSALFSPVRDIGLIVLDESHDNAYKNESAPHYHAGRVAARLAQLHGATFVLGSATPAVEDYFLARERGRPIVEMQELAARGESSLQVQFVDLRTHDNFSRSPLISNTLLAAIAAAMERSEQALVYLNRRGTANVILCNACGWQSLCPHCDLTLTYHGDEHMLRCHVCGFSATLPTQCPACGNADILLKSIGTKAVVSALEKLFPAARIVRFDTDAKKNERIEQNLYSLVNGGADIIVGTQMVGKGLDLPKLSVVGIINADSSLLIPDYTAAEQTYQLISQVVGRVGRGHRAGSVVVQTYDPANPTLQAAVARDWPAFYETEMAERRMFHFPPFTYLLKLRVLRASSTAAEKAALAVAAELQTKHPGVTVDGPAPSFHPRERGKYSWQLLVKSSSRRTLVAIIAALPSGWSYDIDPTNLL